MRGLTHPLRQVSLQFEPRREPALRWIAGHEDRRRCLLLLPLATSAQYKCVDVEGRVTLQQAQCATREQQQPLKLRADEPSVPDPSPAANRPMRVRAG